MVSFRRGLSPCILDRILQQGTTFYVSKHSPTPASDSDFAVATTVAISDSFLANDGNRCPLSWLKKSNRRRACDRLKFKGKIWKKPFLHVFCCFLLGFLAGLTPFTLPRSVGYTNEVRRGFVVEGKIFSNHVQPDGVIDSRSKDGQRVAPKADTVNSENAASLRTSTPTLIQESFEGGQISRPAPGKLLIIVTPTSNRPFQALYLTRLSHTLKLVQPPLLWLVVEMPAQTIETAAILRKTGVMYRHLVCNKTLTNVNDRGVFQRNVALAHIEQHQLDGVVFFADDDNVYTLELFEEMRKIKRFGTWPVAILKHSKSKAILEGPVCDGQKVIGWHTNAESKRLTRFHVNMSGFAFNSTILWDTQRWERLTWKPVRQMESLKEGFQETTFIQQLVEDESQMEGLPNGCSKIMVWHLHIEAPDLIYPPGWIIQHTLNATILLQ